MIRNKKPDSPTLTWSSLQHLLETAIPHVLIVLDCCYAANAARDTTEGTTKELLAACGRENPTLGVGNRSFTSALIEELQAFGKAPFTVAMLHNRLVTIRWKLAFTPFYALLSEHGGHSIEVSPQPPQADPAGSFESLESEMSDDVMDICLPEARSAADTRVLLAVSISNDATCDITEWKKWLVSQAPWDVTNIKVKVEAVFNSHSTMLVTSLPIAAWDMLPEKAAYQFIGFVKSNNLSQVSLCTNNGNERLEGIVTRLEQKLLSIKEQMRPFETELLPVTEGAGERTVATITALNDLRKQLEILRHDIRIQAEEAIVIRKTLELRKNSLDDEWRGLEHEAQDFQDRLGDVKSELFNRKESQTVPNDSSHLLVEEKGQGLSPHKNPIWYDSSKIPPNPNPNINPSNDHLEHLIPHVMNSTAGFMRHLQDDEHKVDEMEKLVATPRRPNASGHDENALHGHKTAWAATVAPASGPPGDANIKGHYSPITPHLDNLVRGLPASYQPMDWKTPWTSQKLQHNSASSITSVESDAASSTTSVDTDTASSTAGVDSDTASSNQDNSAFESDDELIPLVTLKNASKSTLLVSRKGQASSVEGLEIVEDKNAKHAGDRGGSHCQVQELTSVPAFRTTVPTATVTKRESNPFRAPRHTTSEILEPISSMADKESGGGGGGGGRLGENLDLWYCGWCKCGPMRVSVYLHCIYCYRQKNSHATHASSKDVPPPPPPRRRWPGLQHEKHHEADRV
ncbi:MAG: hypothetical protein Q9209_004739 [Squamulea sp. 1 TL-2023]